MGKAFLTIIFCLLFFVSCSKINLESLYESGEYEAVYNSASEIIEESFDSKALFYKALSANRLGKQSEAIETARLYVLLFPNSSSERRAMLKLILHYGSSEEALEAGNSLYSNKDLSKEDSIQYYKILMDNKQYTTANAFLANLSSILSNVEFCFCLINGNAPLWQIINSLDEIYKTEGCSSNFLAAIRLAISKINNDSDRESMRIYLEEAFNGNTQFALIIGDFFYSTNNSRKMRYYWNLAWKDYPDAVDIRIRIASQDGR